jgi:hypothetical protein
MLGSAIGNGTHANRALRTRIRSQCTSDASVLSRTMSVYKETTNHDILPKAFRPAARSTKYISRSNPERWQGYLMIMKRAEVGFVSYSSKNSIFCFLAFILFLHPNLKLGESKME